MTAAPVLKRILLYGGILALAIAVVGSAIGFILVGSIGVSSALVGTAMAVVFLAITAISILIASRYSLGAFFAIVMGAWVLKFIVFLVLIFVLKDQPWLNTQVMFVCIVVAIVGTLAVDVFVVARSRMPYVSDVVLPGEQDSDEKR